MGGDDSTFSTTPHLSQYSCTSQPPAEPYGKIYIKNLIYNIKKILFITKGLIGCGLVSLDGEDYIIKDYWVQGNKKKNINKVNMLKAMCSIPGVLKLVNYWLVKKLDGNIDRTKDY